MDLVSKTGKQTCGAMLSKTWLVISSKWVKMTGKFNRLLQLEKGADFKSSLNGLYQLV